MPKLITCPDLVVLHPTRNDAKVMSNQLVTGILRHNEFGAAINCEQFKATS
jgi:hypothetical protein